MTSQPQSIHDISGPSKDSFALKELKAPTFGDELPAGSQTQRIPGIGAMNQKSKPSGGNSFKRLAEEKK